MPWLRSCSTRLQQKERSLGGHETSHHHELERRSGIAQDALGQQLGTDAEPHCLESIPVGGRCDSHDLAAAVVADGDDEGRVLQLLPEMRAQLVEEFIRAMDGERVGNARCCCCKESHRCDGTSEVHMQMRDAAAANPVAQLGEPLPHRTARRAAGGMTRVAACRSARSARRADAGEAHAIRNRWSSRAAARHGLQIESVRRLLLPPPR